MNTEISADYVKAKELDQKIKVSAQLAQQSLYEMCMGFKQMRDDKLYKALGYENFGDYCENETGMARRSVYNYITIVEKLPQDFVQPLHKFETRKLLLLTKLDEEERTEITETVDLESTTVKELKVEIEKLKASKNMSDKEIDSLNCQNLRLEIERDKITEQRDKMSERVNDLESQIKDLENRPVEVAVQTDSHEVENLKDAMRRVDLDWAEKYAELEEQNLKDRRELLQKIDKLEQGGADEAKVRYILCVEQAKNALDALLYACKDYDSDYAEAFALANNFRTDLFAIFGGAK